MKGAPGCGERLDGPNAPHWLAVLRDSGGLRGAPGGVTRPSDTPPCLACAPLPLLLLWSPQPSLMGPRTGFSSAVSRIFHLLKHSRLLLAGWAPALTRGCHPDLPRPVTRPPGTGHGAASRGLGWGSEGAPRLAGGGGGCGRVWLQETPTFPKSEGGGLSPVSRPQEPSLAPSSGPLRPPLLAQPASSLLKKRYSV